MTVLNLARTLPEFLRQPNVKLDLFHVLFPVILTVVLSTSSLGGGAAFLFVWALARGVAHV